MIYDLPRVRKMVRMLAPAWLSWLSIPAAVAAVGLGLLIASRAPNDGVAILAALAVALVINATLS